jgi:hypothetical protein
MLSTVYSKTISDDIIVIRKINNIILAHCSLFFILLKMIFKFKLYNLYSINGRIHR